MPTIRELLQARNELYVENATTEDEIFKVVFNRQKELEQEKADAKKNRRTPKTPTYLSKQDRHAVMMLAAITQSLQNIIDAWQKLGNRPSFVLGALRTAQTMVYKAMEWQVKDVPEKDFMAVIRDIGYHQVGIMEYEPVRREATK